MQAEHRASAACCELFPGSGRGHYISHGLSNIARKYSIGVYGTYGKALAPEVHAGLGATWPLGACAGTAVLLVYGRPTNLIQASTFATYGETDATTSDIRSKPE